MRSHNVGSKRLDTDDSEVPAELAQREAQDRAKSSGNDSNPRSPVDSLHIDAPKHQDNAHGHRQQKRG